MELARALRALRSALVPALLYSLLYSVSLCYGLAFLLRFAARFGRTRSAFWRAKRRPLPPACLGDPALGEHVYVQLKDVKLHYVESGDRSKPLMLMLHGFPEIWYTWRHQIKEFSKDHWVVAVDLRGSGDSEKPAGRPSYRIGKLVDDVKHLLEALGREQCVLVGHGWGGVIAWYFLMVHPSCVINYVIVGAPHPVVHRKMLINSLSQFRKSWYLFFFQLPYLPELYMRLRDLAPVKNHFATSKDPSPVTEQDVEVYKFSFGKPGALTPAINYFRANLTPDRKLLKRRAEGGRLPRGLVVFGADDKTVNPEAVEKTKRVVYDLAAEVIPGAGHVVHEEAPELVNKALREFLKSGYEAEVKGE